MFLKIGVDHVVSSAGFSVRPVYKRGIGIVYSEGWRKAVIGAEMLVEPRRVLLYTKVLTHWQMGLFPSVRLWRIADTKKLRVVRRVRSALEFLSYPYELDTDESRISIALKLVAETSDPSVRLGLYEALANQRLVLPVQKIPTGLSRDTAGRVRYDTRVEFLSFQTSDGREILAVFTNPENLTKWKSNAPAWIAVDTPSICRLALESGISALQINPGSDRFAELTLDEIQTLARR